jgi:hypothetical protein
LLPFAQASFSSLNVPPEIWPFFCSPHVRVFLSLRVSVFVSEISRENAELFFLAIFALFTYLC